MDLRRILTFKSKSNKHMRSLDVPLRNFDNYEYIDIINCNQCNLKEPPVLIDLSDAKFNKRIQAEETLGF